MNHPNARLGIPVCGIAARDDGGEVAAIARADHGDPHGTALVCPVAGVATPERLFEPCLKHGQFRIIIPIDDINDQH